MKNKKLILKLIVFSAVIIAVVSMITPITYLNTSEVFEAAGHKKPDAYWEAESGILISHATEHDNSNPEDPSTYHRYRFLNILIIKGEEEIFPQKTIEGPLSPTNIPMKMAVIVLFIIFITIFSYICYKSIKDFCRKKTKYFLYAGLLFSGLLVSHLAYNYYSYTFFNTSTLIYTDHINFLYGFYLMIISIILFFTAHFMQKYYFDLPEK